MESKRHIVKLDEINNQDDLILDDDNLCGENPFHISKENKVKIEKLNDPTQQKNCSQQCQKTCQKQCNKSCNKQKKQENIEQKTQNKKLCCKCKEQKPEVRMRNDDMCSPCYLDFLEHKFKVALRKQINIKKEDKVLLCLSGGDNSITLCKMTSEALFNYKQRKMMFSAQILHIDESAIYNLNENQQKSKLKRLEQFSESIQISMHIINIEDIFDTDFEPLLKAIFQTQHPYLELLQQIQHVSSNQNYLDKITLFLNHINQFSEIGSTKEDIIDQLKDILKLNFALKHNFSLIFVGDSGQRTASKVISQICKGRGIEVQNSGQYLIQNYIQTKINEAKPLRDLLSKEILLYNHYKNTKPFCDQDLKLLSTKNIKNKKLPGFGSINFILEEFVDMIQKNTNSSVHTVLNTVEKIVNKYQYDDQLCIMCLKQRDKMFCLLEVEGVHRYLQQDQMQNHDLVNTLQNNYVNQQNIKANILCYACNRLIENSNYKENQFFSTTPFQDLLHHLAIKDNPQLNINDIFLQNHSNS